MLKKLLKVWHFVAIFPVNSQIGSLVAQKPKISLKNLWNKLSFACFFDAATVLSAHSTLASTFHTRNVHVNNSITNFNKSGYVYSPGLARMSMQNISPFLKWSFAVNRFGCAAFLVIISVFYFTRYLPLIEFTFRQSSWFSVNRCRGK